MAGKRKWCLEIDDALDQKVRLLAVRQQKTLVGTVRYLCKIGISVIERLAGEIDDATAEELRELDSLAPFN